LNKSFGFSTSGSISNSNGLDIVLGNQAGNNFLSFIVVSMVGKDNIVVEQFSLGMIGFGKQNLI